MDESQTKDKPIVRRYRWFLIAFGIGFLLVGALVSFCTWRDFARHPDDTLANTISYSLQTGFWSGLIGGTASAAVVFVVVAGKYARNKLFK